MALATLDHGLGLVLAALTAPYPQDPAPQAITLPVETFNLAEYRPEAISARLLIVDSVPIRAYPSDLAMVPVDDALPPPQILWNPSPSALVKIVPAKVRFNMNF
jgi:hypothetical protein